MTGDRQVQPLDLAQEIGAHLLMRHSRAEIGPGFSDGSFEEPPLGLEFKIDLGNGPVHNDSVITYPGISGGKSFFCFLF
ncbi:hypothetical protein [Acidiphilium multivorum]|uniref:hypothetical protein n=1 Tax=Acidiphilium multivorum TaxID=62140 RepID=UPI001B8A98C2|nr:hypothetical protein [Acidiphilium multivorum]